VPPKVKKYIKQEEMYSIYNTTQLASKNSGLLAIKV